MPVTISFDGWTLRRESGELERGGLRIRLPARPGSPARGSRLAAWARMVAIVAVAAMVAIVGSLFTEVRESAVGIASANAVIPVRRLRMSVLPFENLSPDPSNAFFTDGLHEEILSAIASRTANLEVISRTTAMAYRGTSKPVRDIARELNVSHVLEGSVRRDGQSVRLTLRLIAARADTPLWSQTFDRRLEDMLSLQSEVAKEVSSHLAMKLSGNIGDLPPSANPESHDLYLKARALMCTVSAARSPSEQRKAESMLTRAIELDSAFAAAHVARARVGMSRFISSQDVCDANLNAIRADLAAARAMMGDSPPLLTSEAQYAQLVDFDRAEAQRLLTSALSMNPNSSEAHVLLARNLATAGKVDEAMAHFKQAARLDPGNPAVFSDWASTLKMARLAEEAREGRAVLAFVAQEPVTKWNAWYLRMLAAEGALFTGDKARAAEEARRALAMAQPNIHPGIQRHARVQAARVMAWAGAENEAVDLLAQLSTAFPAIGPAEIVRDPLYSIPLAGNAQYAALERKLEAEIEANQGLREYGTRAAEGTPGRRYVDR